MQVFKRILVRIYIYILSSTTYMQKSIQKINKEKIPIYETIFDNEFLLQKISFELHSAVVAKELDWIKETIAYSNKINKNLKKLENSTFKNDIIGIRQSFKEYYLEASNLSEDLWN